MAVGMRILPNPSSRRQRVMNGNTDGGAADAKLAGVVEAVGAAAEWSFWL